MHATGVVTTSLASRSDPKERARRSFDGRRRRCRCRGTPRLIGAARRKRLQCAGPAVYPGINHRHRSLRRMAKRRSPGGQGRVSRRTRNAAAVLFRRRATGIDALCMRDRIVREFTDDDDDDDDRSGTATMLIRVGDTDPCRHSHDATCSDPLSIPFAL